MYIPTSLPPSELARVPGSLKSWLSPSGADPVNLDMLLALCDWRVGLEAGRSGWLFQKTAVRLVEAIGFIYFCWPCPRTSDGSG